MTPETESNNFQSQIFSGGPGWTEISLVMICDKHIGANNTPDAEQAMRGHMSM